MDKSTSDVFKSILKEAGYNHSGSREKIQTFIDGPMTKWFNKYGFKVVNNLTSIPTEKNSFDNKEVNITIAQSLNRKGAGDYRIQVKFSDIYRSYSSQKSSELVLASKITGKNADVYDNSEILMKARGQFQAFMEPKLKEFGLELIKFYGDGDYSSNYNYDIYVRDIEGSSGWKNKYSNYSINEWLKETEDLIVETYNLDLLSDLTTKADGPESIETRFYVQDKGSKNPLFWKVFSYRNSIQIKVAYMDASVKFYDDWYFSRDEYPDPEMIIREIDLDD